MSVVSDAIHGSDKSFAAQKLRSKIVARTARVDVLGLGYVGLPLTMTFERVGFPVIGIDLNPERVDPLKRAKQDLRKQLVQYALAGGAAKCHLM